MITAKELLMESQEMADRLVAWRRTIHEYPEIGLTLPRTAAFVEQTLRALGLAPKHTGTDGATGITALVSGAKPGPVILLRADMDALPLKEDNTLPFRSKIDGAAHMCGHDTHTAMLLGAAALLVRHRAEFPGAVKLMFQPGEEGYNGARHMIDDGLLENPMVDAAIAMHCLTGSRWKTGTVLCALGGQAKASSDSFRITVTGRGTHGATPQHGVDVVHILTEITGLLYDIRSRELSPFTNAVLSVCRIHAGEADNILPDSGYLAGTFRTFDEETQQFFYRRIREIAEGVSGAFGAAASVEFSGSLRPTNNDPALCKEVYSLVQEFVGPEHADVIGPVTGAEDFSEVSRLVPSVYLDLSFGSAEEGYTEAVHSPRCTFNEDALPIGAACHAWCAMRWLEKHAGMIE